MECEAIFIESECSRKNHKAPTIEIFIATHYTCLFGFAGEMSQPHMRARIHTKTMNQHTNTLNIAQTYARTTRSTRSGDETFSQTSKSIEKVNIKIIAVECKTNIFDFINFHSLGPQNGSRQLFIRMFVFDWSLFMAWLLFCWTLKSKQRWVKIEFSRSFEARQQKREKKKLVKLV